MAIIKITWEVLGLHYKNAVNKQDAVPAAVASMQTFGDLLGFNPHLHILCADGCFGKNGMFYAANIDLDAGCLEPLFRHKILSMLKKKGLITDRVIVLILSWRHTGFNVYYTDRIYPSDTKSKENLARYIIRASFSQERMKYYPDEAKVTYQSKYGKDTKEFSSLEWMAALVSHIPDRGGQTVRYFGRYSNAVRGRLKTI